MIEANNPKLDVDDLMEKIRHEIAQRKSVSELRKSLNKEMMQGIQGAVTTPDIETTWIAGTAFSTESLQYVRVLLAEAEAKNAPRQEMPSRINRFPIRLFKGFFPFCFKLHAFLFRDQRFVNTRLNQAVQQMLGNTQAFFEQIYAHLVGLNRQAAEIKDQFSSRSRELETEIKKLEKDLSLGIQDLSKLHQNEASSFRARLDGLEHHAQVLHRELGEHVAHLNELLLAERRHRELRERTQDERSDLLSHRVQLLELAEKEQKIEQSALVKSLELRVNQAETKAQQAEFRVQQVKWQLQKSYKEILLHIEHKEGASNEATTAGVFRNCLNEGLEDFYMALETRFRGAEDKVKERMTVYLPQLIERGINEHSKIVDLGCGRGEWLELLKEQGWQALGLDLNPKMIQRCQDKHLNAKEGDVLNFLLEQDDASIDLISAFHLVEHLETDLLLQVLDECRRVLKKGGLILLETPNPENVLVGSHTFYLDPTHNNPVPSRLLSFLLKWKGFEDIEVFKKSPIPEHMQVLEGPEELVKRFNRLVYGAQDYGILGKNA